MDVSCQFLTTDTLLPKKETWYHLMGGGVNNKAGLGILQTREISTSCWQSKPAWSNPESSHYTN